MSEITLTPATTAWLLAYAASAPERAFDMAAPHYCHLCGDAVPPAEQRRHLRSHATQVRQASRRQTERVTRERVARLRRVRQLQLEVRA